jgi:hypothetical protein
VQPALNTRLSLVSEHISNVSVPEFFCLFDRRLFKNILGFKLNMLPTKILENQIEDMQKTKVYLSKSMLTTIRVYTIYKTHFLRILIVVIDDFLRCV